MASQKDDGDHDEEGGAVARRQQEDGHDARSKKRMRMDRLIQMSMDFAGVHEAHETRTNPSQQHNETRGEASAGRSQPLTQDANEDASAKHAFNATAVQTFESKRTWTTAEDAKLVELVAKLGRKWGEIAKQIATHDRKRCRERYINHLDPTLCRAPWSTDEDRVLLQRFGEIGKRWAKISTSVAGRSPDDVKNRWIQLSSSQRRQAHEKESEEPVKQSTQRWTVAENEALRALVEANGAKDWFFVASQIPGRTDLQCRQHWYRVLDPAIKKGRSTWTPSEDTMLQEKVEELGHQWEKIAKELPGRLGKQCRERYLNHLQSSISAAPWTPDDDEALGTSHQKQPGQWSAIARDLLGRTENAVKNRWNSLARRGDDLERSHSGVTSRDENELR